MNRPITIDTIARTAWSVKRQVRFCFRSPRLIIWSTKEYTDCPDPETPECRRQRLTGQVTLSTGSSVWTTLSLAQLEPCSTRPHLQAPRPSHLFLVSGSGGQRLRPPAASSRRRAPFAQRGRHPVTGPPSPDAFVTTWGRFAVRAARTKHQKHHTLPRTPQRYRHLCRHSLLMRLLDRFVCVCHSHDCHTRRTSIHTRHISFTPLWSGHAGIRPAVLVPWQPRANPAARCPRYTLTIPRRRRISRLPPQPRQPRPPLARRSWTSSPSPGCTACAAAARCPASSCRHWRTAPRGPPPHP